jgi:hypothetical protein
MGIFISALLSSFYPFPDCANSSFQMSYSQIRHSKAVVGFVSSEMEKGHAARVAFFIPLYPV